MRPMKAVGVGLAVLSLAGCASLRMPWVAGDGRLSEQELREQIADFASHFHLLVSQAADLIHDASSDPGVRKRTLLWKIQLIPLVQQASLDSPPQEAFVSMLTLTVMMRQYLTEGGGRDAFGDQQGIATETARELEAELLRIGTRFLGSEEMTRVRGEVESFVASRPIVGRQFTMQSVRRTLASVETTGTFQRVVSVPLSPFRALEGVGDSATEIRHFNATARDFVQAVERLPEQVRWQVELLLYDVEDRESFAAVLTSLDNVSQSAQRTSEAAARLPGDVRSLLQDASATLERLETVIAQARELAGPLEATSDHIEQASLAWTSILQREPGAPQEERRPFDIREWQATVREIGDSAERLERLLQALRETSDAGIVSRAFEPLTLALERSDATIRSWIDLATWRIAQLMLAALVVGLGYRWVSRRIG
jgi:hypothetical protein